MDRIIGISDRANAALHALALAAARGGSISAAEAAGALGVSPSYLAKVLQALAKEGLLVSSRGAAGGFALREDPKLVSCMEILVLLDGELPERACLFAEPVCVARSCPFSLLCAETAGKLSAALSTTSLADLAACFATA